ncbi:MAG: hypothetical protein ACTHKM_02845 [Tsuneonella sp.]
MATQPEPPQPDTINPGAPDETPPVIAPQQEPGGTPDEIQAPSPDFDQPGGNPLETPPPPD